MTFDESVIGGVEGIDDVLALDAALKDLARVSPRQAEMVECRFFGGLDVTETSELLEVSEATVLRDWRAAKAWLASEFVGFDRTRSHADPTLQCPVRGFGDCRPRNREWPATSAGAANRGGVRGRVRQAESIG